MNPAKRRRLDATASTLSKPFHSPLKVTSNHQTAAYVAEQLHADNQPITAVPPKRGTSDSRENPDQEQDITELQQEYAALSLQLRKLRQDLDVVEQAHRIHSTNQEEKLNALILKWRNIAQDAADQVFASVRDRVKDMGGLQAWHNNSLTNSHQDRLGDWCDNKEERASSDPVDSFDGDAADNQVQAGSCAVNGEEPEEEKEVVSCPSDACSTTHLLTKPQHSFTMGLMLRQLDINPDLLAFDTKNEQWMN